MGFLTVLLVSVIFGNYELMCNACSLLPGGAPSCFPNAVDYAKQKGKIKEITYDLEKTKEFYYDSKIADKTFRKIKLGQRCDETIGTKDDIVVCEPDVGEKSYLNSYFPMMRTLGESGFHNAYRVVEYFIITKKEVWNCKNKNEQSTTKIEFKRVVTEMVGKSSMPDIAFYEGVDVRFVPIPYNSTDPTSSQGTERIPIVREVKYVSTQYQVPPFKYEGFIEFNIPKNFKLEDLSMFNQLSDGSNTYFKILKNYESMRWTHNGNVNQVRGIEKPLILGDSNEVAICELNQKDPELYSLKYLTEWNSLRFDHHRPNGDRYETIPLEKKDFRKGFMVIKHEIWNCETKKGGQKFIKSVLEFLTKLFVVDVRIDKNDVIDLWKFQIDQEFYGIAVREVAYYNDKHEFITYMGSIEEKNYSPDNIPLSAVEEREPVPIKGKRPNVVN
ncbi:uncharacterized protein LOC111060279 [Nilaparvata lugens]|uniref:uncharacterized protein LOC111060279 n=1 Tax=Nilaparvata lugens TaxID=108931 RepID=UPI00193DD9CB|nr:uncharacterized protein LOC111060279 [Nilaparvata lugens]